MARRTCLKAFPDIPGQEFNNSIMNMNKSRIVIIFVLTLIAGLFSGCAETIPKPEIYKIFYPSPPDLPRVQFLTSLTGEKDFAKRKSAFEAFVTGTGDSKRRLDKPYGVALWGGKIYVCDTNHGVVVFDLEKRTYSDLQGAQGMGKLFQPINIRIDPDGNKYVSDPIRGQVVVFDKNDFYIAAFGGGPDEWRPVDAVPYGDELYVADMKNFRLVVLDRKNGTVLRQIGQTGPPENWIVRPTNLAFDKEGHLFVSDMGRFQILKLDRDGHFLGSIGEVGRESGTFSRPKGVAFDRENRLYVVDTAFANVQVFNKDDNLLMGFGHSGRGPGDLDLPAGITTDYDHIKYFQQYADPNFEIENLVVVVNQFGDHAVNIYAMGRERGKHYPTDAELLEQIKAKLAEKAAKAAKEKADKEKAVKEKTEQEKVVKEKTGKEQGDQGQTTEIKGGPDKERQ